MDNRFEIYDVANGVKIYSYKTDRFKTGRLSFNIVLPLKKDVSDNAILPYILNRSCDRYPSYRELNKKLAELYGATLTPSVAKAGDNHILRLSMTMIDNKFALDDEDIYFECAKLLFGLIFKPHVDENGFDEAEVIREKRLMTERLESEKNDKRVYALRRCEEIMCGDELYSANVYGTKEGIEALTPLSIYEAYKNVLETGYIAVNVVGSVDVEKISELLKSFLSESGVCRREIAISDTQVIESAGPVKRVTEELPVNQGKLVLGFRTGSNVQTLEENYPVLRIMTDIFGGGTYSRLFMNVREKMSLCYYCSARLYRQKGIIIVQSGIECENAEIAEKEILNQLKSIAEGDVTKEDLKSSLLSMRDSFSSTCDTPEDIDAWAFSQICNPSFETPDEIIAKLEKVTEEEIAAAAKAVTLDTVFMLKGEE